MSTVLLLYSQPILLYACCFNYLYLVSSAQIFADVIFYVSLFCKFWRKDPDDSDGIVHLFQYKCPKRNVICWMSDFAPFSRRKKQMG